MALKMMESFLRLRLEFKNDGILTDAQKSQGLKKSWILVHQQLRTVAALSDFIMQKFHLNHGLLLSMDGFALPPFVSTSILKDKDVISVQKMGHLTIEGRDTTNKVEARQIVATDCVSNGTLLLENEEFDKERGGNKREESNDESVEQHEERKANDHLGHGNDISKKRKASQKLQGSKNDQFQEKGEDVDGATKISGSTQKGPSRSARRQYAKRRMLREMKKIQENNVDSPSKEVKKWKKRQSKAEKRAGPNQLYNEGFDQPKGLFHWKQFGETDLSKARIKPEEENQNHNAIGNSKKDINTSNEVIPIEIRPGHIRFEALEEDQELQQSQVSLELSNGKESQARKREKNGEQIKDPHELKEAKLENVGARELMDLAKLPPLTGMPKEGDVIAYRLLEISSSWTVEISPHRVGTVSSYNSQSSKIILMPVPWCPIPSKCSDEDECTAQQDGNIYSKDGSLEIDFTYLVDVRTVENNDLAPSASKETEKHANGGPLCNENAVTSMPLASNEKCTDSMVKGNGGPNQCNSAQAPSTPVEVAVDLWEKLSEALNFKKEELSKESNWGKVTTPNRNAWSYRAFTGSTVRPTVSYQGRGRKYGRS